MRRIWLAFVVVCLLMTTAVALGATLGTRYWAPHPTRMLGSDSRRKARPHSPRRTSRGHKHKTTRPKKQMTTRRRHPTANDPILFGDQTIESTTDSITTGSARAFPVSDPTTGTAMSISVYVDARNRARTLIAGLYSDSSGRPGSLLTSGSFSSPQAGAWDTVTVTSAPVTAGTAYWIAILGQGGRLSFRDGSGGPCTSVSSSQNTLTSLPPSWSGGALHSRCPVSAYVSGTVASTGGPPPSAPVNTALPVISGTPAQGTTLSTTTGSWTGSPISYAYQWQDCGTNGSGCTAISGATASTYKLAASDVGHTIRSVVTATSAGGSTPATSNPTAPVSASRPPPVPPTNTAPPTISGNPTQGAALTVTTGSWSGDTPMTFAYQWQRCSSATCSNISGATGASYTVQSTDVGDTIDAVVTAANDAGSASATAAPTTAVTAPGTRSFPYYGDTGTPAGWTPTSVQTTDMHVTTAGAVIQDVQFQNSANLYIDAPNVTVKDDEFQGGSVRNCDDWFNGSAYAPCKKGLLVQNTTFDLIPGYTWDSYDLWPGAHLTQAISTSGPITTLPATVDRSMVAGSDLLVYSATRAQVWTTTAAITVGQTSIPVQRQTPNANYPSGSNLGSNIQGSCQPAIWLADWKADHIKVWRKCAGVYVGDHSNGFCQTGQNHPSTPVQGSCPGEVDNSYFSLTNGPANNYQGPYHSEGVQCYGGDQITANNDTIEITDASHGTSPFFCPLNQGNTAAYVNGLLVMDGSSVAGATNFDGTLSNYDCCNNGFRDGVPGTVTNLHVVAHSYTSGQPVDVNCSVITSWQADIVTIDRPAGGEPNDDPGGTFDPTAPYNITSTVSSIPCAGVGN